MDFTPPIAHNNADIAPVSFATTYPGEAAAHAAATGGIVVSVMNWAPTVLGAIAGFVALCWYLICIWESSTIQHFVRNRRMVWKARKIARLKAKQKIVSAQLDALEIVRVARSVAREKIATAAHDAAALVATETTEQLVKLPPV